MSSLEKIKNNKSIVVVILVVLGGIVYVLYVKLYKKNPVDCQISNNWEWDLCNCNNPDSSGMGYSIGRKTIIRQESNGGKACPDPTSDALFKREKCSCRAENTNDCIYSDWKTSGDCSVVCGGGLQPQTRYGTTPHDDPSLCNDTWRSIPCNTQPCEIYITPTPQKGSDRLYTKWIGFDRTLILNRDNSVVFTDGSNIKNGIITSISGNIIQVTYNDKEVISYQFEVGNEDTYNDSLSDLNHLYEFQSTTGHY